MQHSELNWNANPVPEFKSSQTGCRIFIQIRKADNWCKSCFVVIHTEKIKLLFTEKCH